MIIMSNRGCKIPVIPFNLDVFLAIVSDELPFFQINPCQHPCQKVTCISRNVIITLSFLAEQLHTVDTLAHQVDFLFSVIDR